MKSILTLLATLLLSLNSFAQAPILFNYQSVVRNTNGGALVSSRTITMRISILQGSASGPAVYVEQHTPTTDVNGLVTISVGGGTVQSGSMSSLAWSQGNFYIKTEIDPIGNIQTPSYTIVGVDRLKSVPFAMYANQAGHSIGELFGGGIIFHLWRDPSGIEHGLIASLNSLGNSANPLASIGTNHTNGAANTAAAVASLGGGAANSAVGLCDSYAVGQFADWYLPSSLELKLLYEQSVAINSILDNDNNPATNGLNAPGDSWWSSTRVSTSACSNCAFRVKTDLQDENFPGNLSVYGQANVKSVRAIRQF
jgi:hypothetical protein